MSKCWKKMTKNDMKKLLLLAICAMAVMISCKQKGQTAPADSTDSVTAVIDSTPPRCRCS